MKLARFAIAFAGVNTAAAIKVEGQNPSKLPQVPSVTNAGADGLPELPSLDSITGDFSTAEQGIDAQVQALQAQLAKVKQTSKDRLAREKKVYDEKLKDQERKNQVVLKENGALAKELMSLHKTNDDLLKKVREEVRANEFQREELSALETQLKTLEAETEKTVAATDDSDAPELSFLKATKAATTTLAPALKPSVELQALHFRGLQTSFLQTDQIIRDSKLPSFGSLLTGAEEPADVVQAEAVSVVAVLEGSLKTLRAKSKTTEENLKQLFAQSYKAGSKRYDALMSQQSMLKKSLQEMKAFQAKLQAADVHLLATQKKLETQIHSEGEFLSKLGRIALDPSQAAIPALTQLR
jgi:chromosome segregation ATPase